MNNDDNRQYDSASTYLYNNRYLIYLESAKKYIY